MRFSKEAAFLSNLRSKNKEVKIDHEIIIKDFPILAKMDSMPRANKSVHKILKQILAIFHDTKHRMICKKLRNLNSKEGLVLFVKIKI